MAEKNTLAAADYIVIGVMLIVSASIGIYYRFTGGRQKTTEEYFVADRRMSVTTVAIALMASYLSAVSLLGVSAENYVYGTQYAVINLSYGLATPIVAYLYLPVFFKLQATSAFEYLDKRFGHETRIVASLAFILQLLLYTGVVLYAPALALEATTGISTALSIVIIGLVCTFYSSIGGIKAVLITDVFQSLLMFVAIITVIITAAVNVGGLGEIWRIADQENRIEFDNISPDPTTRHSWWSLTIGGLFTYLSLYACNQVQVQRMLTVRNLAAAQKALWWSWPIASTMSIITCFSGLAMFSRYYDCDPVKTNKITSKDQLMPLYVMDTLSSYPGVPGLFVAGIFSAGLSTVSATLNSLAAIILEDFVKPVYSRRGKVMSTKFSVLASKGLAMLVGLCCVALAFVGGYLGGVLQAALTIFGVIGGPMLGLFTLGMMTESGNQKGAIIGLLSSLAFFLWIGFGQPRPVPAALPVRVDGCNLTVNFPGGNITRRAIQEETSYFYLYQISYMWYCPLGFLLCLVIGYLVSRITQFVLKEEPAELDSNLFTPFLASRITERRERKRNRIFCEMTDSAGKQEDGRATANAAEKM
ncbi:putative sodium-dependent multivitamin transporter [Venturia canescens]|uniref:putative sodium-dependent multivitamin transporter n=1 Tax=Venturia canescens TaxID=32260 RepID=UPI001C9CD183|nr:putative sodium-dependent multivitamin transporter [Venturia canescens]XP_043277280.1 putative sodium-dependent multivitamin transporter [Venturia canescens]XP_043277281.1 putative sodium-dependent multivitamin transporter [Venturia canescens]